MFRQPGDQKSYIPTYLGEERSTRVCECVKGCLKYCSGFICCVNFRPKNNTISFMSVFLFVLLLNNFLCVLLFIACFNNRFTPFQFILFYLFLLLVFVFIYNVMFYLLRIFLKGRFSSYLFFSSSLALFFEICCAKHMSNIMSSKYPQVYIFGTQSATKTLEKFVINLYMLEAKILLYT